MQLVFSKCPVLLREDNAHSIPLNLLYYCNNRNNNLDWRLVGNCDYILNPTSHKGLCRGSCKGHCWHFCSGLILEFLQVLRNYFETVPSVSGFSSFPQNVRSQSLTCLTIISMRQAGSRLSESGTFSCHLSACCLVFIRINEVSGWRGFSESGQKK